MYLIVSTIGMPSQNIINNSKLSDVIFTFDRKSIRGYKNIYFNDYVSSLLILETDLNKKILYSLVSYIVNHLIYC